MYLQSVKPVAFIYINIFEWNNFPTKYDALNTVSDRFIATLKFQIFSIKSKKMLKMLRHLRISSMMVKMYKYSMESEAVIRGFTIKKLL